MINSIDIKNDRVSLIVHLDGEDILFFTVPLEDDGSDNWKRVQDWLDEGNEISDRLAYDKFYSHQRRTEYPNLEEQLDYIYHNGIDKWKEDIIKPVKDKFPKP